MTEVFRLLAAFMMGTALGLFFFGVLRLTVQFLPAARRPGLLILGSFLVRSGITAFGFSLVMGGHWERVLPCLLGFLLVRQALVRRCRPQPESSFSE